MCDPVAAGVSIHYYGLGDGHGTYIITPFITFPVTQAPVEDWSWNTVHSLA